jgi:hypothetical protein
MLLGRMKYSMSLQRKHYSSALIDGQRAAYLLKATAQVEGDCEEVGGKQEEDAPPQKQPKRAIPARARMLLPKIPRG